MTFIYDLGRTVCVLLFEKKKNAAMYGRKIAFSLKMTLLIQKIAKQDEGTVDERVREVPESDKTVCRETELALGYETQDRGGARVVCSFVDIVAVM